MAKKSSTPEQETIESLQKRLHSLNKSIKSEQSKRSQFTTVENPDYVFNKSNFQREMIDYVLRNDDFKASDLAEIMQRHLFGNEKFTHEHSKQSITEALTDAFKDQMKDLLKGKAELLEAKNIKEEHKSAMYLAKNAEKYGSILWSAVKYAFSKVKEKWKAGKMKSAVHDMAQKIGNKDDWVKPVQSAIEKAAAILEKGDPAEIKKLFGDKNSPAAGELKAAAKKLSKHQVKEAKVTASKPRANNVCGKTIQHTK